ncbi:MAG: thioredoxin [Candidatus Caldatribacteriota bacterium]|nr:thioredoxin [Atribacterota bacterium]MDD3031878.1 thioredoxin [Atribacterota bacterium]MDD3641678.1 thioredoxin [Atribacterota bacterium]MDD4288112.1 thioredoxin [Atribacterota bacterium]MDD4764857.1 thioredoxin [Atribacterota bacterium]
MTEKSILDVNEDNFQKEVLESSLPVLVDMWAPWCMPCKMVAPAVEKIAKDNIDKLKVCKLNVDDNQNIAVNHNIQGIPALLIFKNGKEVDRIVGAVPPQAIQSKLDSIF